MAASEQELGELHSLLTQAMKEALQSGEPSPALLNVVRAFLRDNGIEADPLFGEVNEIVSSLPFVDPCLSTSTPATTAEAIEKSDTPLEKTAPDAAEGEE